jgi:ABC-type transport system involved in cytochrome c biogenesis permease subunit
MSQWSTTLGLAVLGMAAAAASVFAIVNVRPGNRKLDFWQCVLTAICGLGCLILFVVRRAMADRGGPPLAAHVDGLILVALLLAGAILLARLRRGLAHLDAFALPVLTLILAWAVCASHWTFRLFHLIDPTGSRPTWWVLHMAAVYLGTVFLAVAAIGGAMYLHLERRIRQRTAIPAANGWGSLERIEWLIRRAAAGGFALISLALITGIIIAASGQSDLGSGWWYSPKVILAVVVWMTTGLLVGVRYAGRFRGRRAAWLSIAALVLMLVIFAMVNALQAKGARARVAAGSQRLVSVMRAGPLAPSHG